MSTLKFDFGIFQFLQAEHNKIVDFMQQGHMMEEQECFRPPDELSDEELFEFQALHTPDEDKENALQQEGKKKRRCYPLYRKNKNRFSDMPAEGFSPGHAGNLRCTKCNQIKDRKCVTTQIQVTLVEAIHHNDVSTVREVVHERRLNPNFEVHMRSPICRASAVGNTEILKLLLDAGAELNTPDYADLLWERRPIHLAASKGHFSALKLLVQRGANINQPDNDQRTPLHWVAMYGHAHMIKWMLETGASVDLAQTDGFTPLHTACCLGHVDVCRQLIDGGAQVSRRDRDGWTPMHTAVCYGYHSIVQLLIEKGADPLATTSSNNDSPLHIAASKGNVEIMGMLLKVGVPIEGKNNYGSTPLHTAVYYNRQDAAHFLIKAGADVNTKNYTGSCPLYLAAVRIEMHTLRLLLASGCRVTPGIHLPVAPESPSLAARMEELASRPQSLIDLCLLQVRQTLAPHLQNNANLLPLPAAVKRALVLQDLTCTDPDGLDCLSASAS